MTGGVLSMVDRFANNFRPLDILVTAVATHLLPQHEAESYTCPSGLHYCGTVCAGYYCRPTGDLYEARWIFCGDRVCNGPNKYQECCDCCSD
jgi:hypothetical protein